MRTENLTYPKDNHFNSYPSGRQYIRIDHQSHPASRQIRVKMICTMSAALRVTSEREGCTDPRWPSSPLVQSCSHYDCNQQINNKLVDLDERMAGGAAISRTVLYPTHLNQAFLLNDDAIKLFEATVNLLNLTIVVMILAALYSTGCTRYNMFSARSPACSDVMA